MYFYDAKSLNEALDHLRGEEFHSIRQVGSALTALWPFFEATGVDRPGFTQFVTRMLDSAQDRRIVEAPNAGAALAGLIEDFVAPKDSLRQAVSHACADCDSSNDWPTAPRKSTSAAYGALAQPVTERSVTLCMRTGLRTPYRAAQGLFSCDHHHPALDRAAVRRMMRSLGPEFGPEPPSGGSLARV